MVRARSTSLVRRASAAALLALAMSLDERVSFGSWYPYGVAQARARTHDQVLSDLRPRLRPGLEASAKAEGLAYPPPELVLIGLKEERSLEVWAPAGRAWHRLRAYHILAASGGPGPKLREGDLQVPEGIYRLTVFNPNSSYHLSVRVDYPNHEDLAAARADRRDRLGGDIYIHGRAVSIGCLALGDAAIEELYVLLADVGLPHAKVLLAPNAKPAASPDGPAWLAERYARLRVELQRIRAQPTTR